MKKILILIGFLYSLNSFSQSTVLLRGDTIRVYKQGGDAVLKVDSTLILSKFKQGNSNDSVLTWDPVSKKVRMVDRSGFSGGGGSSGSGSNSQRVQTHTSGATLTVSANSNTVRVDPSTAIDTLTITLPNLSNPNSLDSLVVNIFFGGVIAPRSEVVGHLIIDTTGGNLLYQESTPSVIYSGEHLSYRFDTTNNFWRRENNYTTREEQNDILQQAAIIDSFQYITYADTVTWDYTTGKKKTILLTGNSVLADIENSLNGSAGILKIIQDATGGRRLELPGDTATGWFYGFPNSVQVRGWVRDENGFRWLSPDFYSAPVDYDPDVQSFITRVAVAGGTLTNVQKSAINDFIIELKAQSLYSGIYEMYLFVGGAEASYQLGFKGVTTMNFIGPNWVFDAEGAYCNGVGGTYGETGIIPSTAISSINDFSVSYYLQTDVSGGGGGVGGETAVGVRTGAIQTINLIPELSGTSYGDPGSEQAGQRMTWGSVSDSRGLWTLTRTTSTRADLYLNATSVANTTNVNNGSLPTEEFHLNSTNQGGTDTGNAAVKCSFLSVGTSRSSGNETLFYNAVQALQTSFSRNK